MNIYLILLSLLISSLCTCHGAQETEEPPEGYYAFVESPGAEPPRVRPPPYSHSRVRCKHDNIKSPHVSPNNLCGDLNKGHIPINPLGQNVMGMPYPFELIRNHTLKYLSRTLPILRADETLPKVARMEDELIAQNTISPYKGERVKRDTTNPEPEKEDHQEPVEEVKVEGRSTDATNLGSRGKFCEQGGVLCMLYKAINGELLSSSTTGSTQTSSSSQLAAERRDEPAPAPRYEGPPTPCPAKVEYATPVFAKNYQGIWRYVVQIPYEGYFTQTVEVTRCLQQRCHYLDGGCLSSPRWLSLLVAEIYYPDTVLGPDSNTPNRQPVSPSQPPPSVQDFQAYQQYLQRRAGLQAEPSTSTPRSQATHCDGVDNLGCFQVRLYYDWFLVPGSCKCWRPDYFNKYVRRKSSSSTTEL